MQDRKITPQASERIAADDFSNESLPAGYENRLKSGGTAGHESPGLERREIAGWDVYNAICVPGANSNTERTKPEGPKGQMPDRCLRRKRSSYC